MFFYYIISLNFRSYLSSISNNLPILFFEQWMSLRGRMTLCYRYSQHICSFRRGLPPCLLFWTCGGLLETLFYSIHVARSLCASRFGKWCRCWSFCRSLASSPSRIDPRVSGRIRSHSHVFQHHTLVWQDLFFYRDRSLQDHGWQANHFVWWNHHVDQYSLISSSL